MKNGVLTIPLSGRNPSRLALSSNDVLASAPVSQKSLPAGLPEFVAGNENALAARALIPFLTESADSQSFALCSPLVLYGPHGSGKSHLAQGLAEHWRASFPHIVVTCLTGAEFAREYASALEEGRLDAWRDEIRETGLFVLEDLGEMVGKTSAQQELIHTLDALLDRQSLIVLTARTLPNHWPTLLPALRSRLSAALGVPLALPQRATRRAILQRLAEGRNLPLSRQALDGLADGISGGVPMLASAIWELELVARLDGEAICPERVQRLVTHRDTAAAPSLRDIARLTAKHFGLKLSELKSPERRRSLVAGRGMAMYLARQLTSCSLGEIGEFFGGRDHTTVMHGCRRMQELLRRDAALRQALTEIQQMLATS